MDKVDMEKQYDEIGRDYLLGQKEFFSKREDQAIGFIKCSLADVHGKTILDFGCGNGSDMKRYEEMGAKSIFGIDTSGFMVSEAKKNIGDPEKVFVSDIQNTGFKDGSFDAVVGRFSLHYLDKLDLAYEEVARILKKTGTFIFVVHHPLKDLVMQKNKKYGEKEIIEVKLYGDKVAIHFPTHTFKEYLSEEFFKHFYLDGFEEGKSPEEYLDEFKTPGFIGIKAVKK